MSKDFCTFGYNLVASAVFLSAMSVSNCFTSVLYCVFVTRFRFRFVSAVRTLLMADLMIGMSQFSLNSSRFYG